MDRDTLRNLRAFAVLDEPRHAEAGDYIVIGGELKRINKVARSFDGDLCVYVDGDDDFHFIGRRRIYRAKGGVEDGQV